MTKQYYPSVLALCDDIVARFAKIFLLRYKHKLIATMRNNGCITFTLSVGNVAREVYCIDSIPRKPANQAFI
jgi:hypothetical protein